MKQIYDFAIKWAKKFKNSETNYIELVDHYLGDDCSALGFDMDCGEAFSQVYGKAFNNNKELKKIIDDVTDIKLLGSAVFSNWRYFNHWAYSGEEIAEPENRAWFIIALDRLAELARENMNIFEGEPKKMRLVSNNICYGPEPEPDDEVEQHLTINADGRVCFSAYAYGNENEYEKHKKSRNSDFYIGKSCAEWLLNKVAAYFSKSYNEIDVTDIGTWTLELTNTEGRTYEYYGALCAYFEIDDTNLSDLLRESLDMWDLFAFDGRAKFDIINRIVIDYHRLSKIKPPKVPEDVSWKFVTWDYTEQLIIDRKTETLEHIQNIGAECRVSRKYEIQGGIKNLLNGFDDDLFEYIEGNPEDVIESPNESKDYRITIDYKNSPQKAITGAFDKKGLPEDFEEFAETVFDFMSFYGLGEILDPSVYKKAKRRITEYIFCSVIFDEGQKSYYYLTEDDSINTGDFVLVPAGKDNRESIVKVVNIEYFTEDEAPWPVDKAKHIIRKCTDDDFDLPEPEQSNTDDKNKPEEYYDEIECPMERKGKVLALFPEYEIIEYTNTEKEYENLEDDAVILEIINPYRSENLDIKIYDEFILFFSCWHSHYPLYEYDFAELKKDALAIVNGEIGVLCFFINDDCICSSLLREEISHFTDPYKLIDKMAFDEYFLKKIRDNGVDIYADYWEPNGCYEFNVEKEGSAKSAYTFPRKYNVRFVLKDGQCCGSGAQKQYDNETAFITYVHIDENANSTVELKKSVIRKLENDAKKTGACKIFANIKADELDLYISLGYMETEKFDNNKIHNLCGAAVKFDKTMIKFL